MFDRKSLVSLGNVIAREWREVEEARKCQDYIDVLKSSESLLWNSSLREGLATIVIADANHCLNCRDEKSDSWLRLSLDSLPASACGS